MKETVATSGSNLKALALMLGVAACGGSTDGSGGGANGGVGEAGVVKGLVVDTQGRPLPEAQVIVCSTVFSNSSVTRRSGSDGRYSMDLTCNATEYPKALIYVRSGS